MSTNLKWKLQEVELLGISRPHLGGERTIVPGQKLHASLAFKPKEYVPQASFSNEIAGGSWNDLIGEGSMDNLNWADSWGTLLELDLFDYEGTIDDAAKKLGEVVHESHSHIFHRLAFVALSSMFTTVYVRNNTKRPFPPR